MFDRTVPLANRNSPSQSLGEIGFGESDRLLHRQTQRQVSGNGGGEGTARTMGVAAIHPLHTKLPKPSPGEKDVYDLIASAVPAFDDRRPGSHLHDGLGSASGRVPIFNGKSYQPLCFGKVRSDHLSDRNEAVNEGGNRRFL